MDSVTGTLDDPEILTNAAQSADAVINAASADHPGSVVTLVTALERSGKLLIHTAGSDCGYGTWVREGASCRRSMARSSSVIGGLAVKRDQAAGPDAIENCKQQRICGSLTARFSLCEQVARSLHCSLRFRRGKAFDQEQCVEQRGGALPNTKFSIQPNAGGHSATAVYFPPMIIPPSLEPPAWARPCPFTGSPPNDEMAWHGKVRMAQARPRVARHGLAGSGVPLAGAAIASGPGQPH